MKSEQLQQIDVCVEALITSGALPALPPLRTWGGICSQSRSCAVCELPIEPGTYEVEADCVDGVQRAYHTACYFALERARPANRA